MSLTISFFVSCGPIIAIENMNINRLSSKIMDDFTIEANTIIASLKVGETKEEKFKDKLNPILDKYQLRIDEFNTKFKNRNYKLVISNLIIIDSILKDDQTVNIYKLRTKRVPDGRLTDDEVTPVVFKSGRLVNIGWSGFTE